MIAGGTKVHSPNDIPPRLPAAPAGPADRELLERFIRNQDEAAFAALVERHGPMVLRVCLRVLGQAQEAEDAFQATFLILVRKAGAIAKPDLLANWLYGVAARTALKARARAVRRAQLERTVSLVPRPPNNEDDRTDLLVHLDEELEQLPHKYRAPLVLCYLDGLTNQEAARRLGCPAGSISYRLARGREILRQRLGCRGMAPAAFALLLRNQLGLGELSQGLSNQTVQTAMGLARGGTLATVATPAVRQLVEGMLLSTWRRNLVVLLLVAMALLGLLAVGAPMAGFWPLSSGEANTPKPCH